MKSCLAARWITYVHHAVRLPTVPTTSMTLCNVLPLCQRSIQLRDAATRESILIRNIQKVYDAATTIRATQMPRDSQAQEILCTVGGIVGRYPASVSGDGNCLYNALSIALKGDESLASRLRLDVAVELL